MEVSLKQLKKVMDKSTFTTFLGEKIAAYISDIIDDTKDFELEEDEVSENKLLGHFTLGDIQYARQGVPQIQVCFDIDPNGILKVSAKDKATGKANSITISGSANMSRGDIDIAIREARNYESTHRMI